MQQHLTEEWLSWHFIFSTCCPGRGLRENLQMIKNGSSIHRFVTSPQITVLKRFLALKLSSAFRCGQSITPRGSGPTAARSTFPGKGKSIVSARTLGQMLMVTPGLRRSSGLALSPFSLQLRDKTSVCSLFMNNLLTMQGSPWYNINNLRKNTSQRRKYQLPCIAWIGFEIPLHVKWEWFLELRVFNWRKDSHFNKSPSIKKHDPAG